MTGPATYSSQVMANTLTVGHPSVFGADHCRKPSAAADYDLPCAAVSAGLPLHNTAVCILPQLQPAGSEMGEGVVTVQPCARGEVGEVVVAGLPVALGYLNQPQLTAQRFPHMRLPPQQQLSQVSVLLGEHTQLPEVDRVSNSQLVGASDSQQDHPLAVTLCGPEGVRVFRTRDLGYITPEGERQAVRS